MSVHAPPHLARQLQQHARPPLLQRFGTASCIESAAAALDVLRAGGVWAHVLTVTVMVFNAAGWWLHGHGILPGESAIDMAVWSLHDAWSIGIGTLSEVPSPGQYGGHLAVLIDERWLLDLSIDQASQPDYGVNLAPLLVAIDPARLDSDGEVVTLADGTVLVYRSNLTPWARAYRRMRAWTNKRQRAEVAAAVRARLGE